MADERDELERVLFAGGGTGGHVYMCVALAEHLQSQNPAIEILFAGTQSGMESRILPPLGYQLETIQIGGLKKVGLARWVRTMLQLPRSLAGSIRILRRFRPNIAVGVGGYSSGPLVLAARLLRIPSLIIEPNVFPGFTNRLLGWICSGVAVAFAETAEWFRNKARITGIPVRQAFFRIRESGFKNSPLRLLVFGGSQGSRPINNLLVEALPHLPRERVKIVHQTGPAEFESVRAAYEQAGVDAEVLDYILDMPTYFSDADLLVARAGALTVAEICAAGRPALLIPFPQATDDHQRKNARALQDRGAAVLLNQSTTDGARLAGEILRLEEDRSELSSMAHRCRVLAKPDARTRIIRFMEEIVGR